MSLFTKKKYLLAILIALLVILTMVAIYTIPLVKDPNYYVDTEKECIENNGRWLRASYKQGFCSYLNTEESCVKNGGQWSTGDDACVFTGFNL